MHHYALFQNVLSLMCSSLLPRGAVPLSRAHNDLVLPSLFKGSPAVIEFAKAGAEHHFYPPSTPASNLGDTCGDRYESAEAPTLSGGLVPADMVTRTLSKLSVYTFGQGCALPFNGHRPFPTLGREGSR
jgi:hypothetical protein